jgi:hypothetical protein
MLKKQLFFNKDLRIRVLYTQAQALGYTPQQGTPNLALDSAFPMLVCFFHGWIHSPQQYCMDMAHNTPLNSVQNLYKG